MLSIAKIVPVLPLAGSDGRRTQPSQVQGLAMAQSGAHKVALSFLSHVEFPQVPLVALAGLDAVG